MWYEPRDSLVSLATAQYKQSIFVLLPAGWREAANLLVLFLLGLRKYFRPTRATPCTDSREIWHGRVARGSAWPCEISPPLVHGVGTRPPKVENLHILIKIRPTGAKPLTDFYKC